jgi:hypothetical protein
MLPDSFLACLPVFADCFTGPGYRRFVALLTGWLLCIGKHTVTGVMRAAGVVGKREHSGYHRFFSRGAWNPDRVGLTLMRLILQLLPKDRRVVLSIDDTLARHTGKHISSAGMHRDPLLSCHKRPFWHFGHKWVVLAVVVPFPRWGKVFSLPVLVRLYRTEKVNQAQGLPHRKTTELACELIQRASAAFPLRRFLLLGDNDYANRSILRPLPQNFDFLGRGRLDAALYAPPPRPRGRGRPRVRGRRLASPERRAQRGRWQTLEVEIHGRTVELRLQVFDALWYTVAPKRLLRFVLVRGWPGHDKDDLLVTTDLSLTGRQVIEAYCLRWSLEETFGWVKSRLGFQDPHNRTEHAVHRTAPMALWTYSLVVYWYARWSKRRTRFPFRKAPWYRTKTAPSFADMLATLRRQSWTLWISDQAQRGPFDQKDLEPLLDAIGYG